MNASLSSRWERSHTRLALRLVAGGLVVFVGADHYYEYMAEHYSVLPTIGTLFLLNFIGATICGLLLLAPLERVSQTVGRVTWWLAALGGFTIGITSLIGLLVSEQTPLFGYMELNYRPAVLVGLASEAASALACAALLALKLRDLRRAREGRRALLGADGVSPSEPRRSAQQPPTGDPTRDAPGRDAHPATAVSSS